MNPNDYKNYKAEIQAGQPYALHNGALAKDIYSSLKTDCPTATIYLGRYTQYICLDDAARRKLAKDLKAEYQRKANELQGLDELIQKVEGAAL